MATSVQMQCHGSVNSEFDLQLPARTYRDLNFSAQCEHSVCVRGCNCSQSPEASKEISTLPRHLVSSVALCSKQGVSAALPPADGYFRSFTVVPQILHKRFPSIKHVVTLTSHHEK